MTRTNYGRQRNGTTGTRLLVVPLFLSSTNHDDCIFLDFCRQECLGRTYQYKWYVVDVGQIFCVGCFRIPLPFFSPAFLSFRLVLYFKGILTSYLLCFLSHTHTLSLSVSLFLSLSCTSKQRQVIFLQSLAFSYPKSPPKMVK